jgi:acyl-CoA thioester hydrolase
MIEPPPGMRPLRVRMPIKIQTYDIDFAAHVNNQVYVRWLEDLRMELLRVYYPIERLMAEGLAPILASTEIHYKRPLVLGDAPVGEVWVARLGAATVQLHAEITHGEHLCAHATQRLVLLHLQTQKPVRWPAAFRAAFEQEV